jgi:hypothetical protein
MLEIFLPLRGVRFKFNSFWLKSDLEPLNLIFLAAARGRGAT